MPITNSKMFLSPARAQHITHAVYPGLPLEPDQIRLIKLLPGAWTDPVRCQLFNVLHPSVEHRYHTLSYVWGSRRVTRAMVVNNRPYPATINLESALRHLRERYPDGIVLWVDALCINQDATDERTHQVQLMGHIYKMCEKVIVFLGDRLDGTNKLSKHPPTMVDFDKNYTEEMSVGAHGERSSDQDMNMVGVFRLIQELSMDVHIHEISSLNLDSSAKQHPGMGTAISDDTDEQRIEKQQLHAQSWREQQDRRTHLVENLRKLMHPPFTPWWNRIWVIQEIVAPPLVDIVYGGCSAPWTMFTSAVWGLMKHNRHCCSDAYARLGQDLHKVLADFCQRVAGIDGLRTVQNTFGCQVREPEYGHRSLLELLRMFRDRTASDPRDKVYALLSLVNLEKGRLIPPMLPDYALTEIEVFTQATVECIYASRSLSVFSTELGRKFRNDLPSWVPDWGAPGGYAYTIRAHAVELYDACPVVKPINYYVDLAITPRLGVRGFDFDRIRSLGDTMWGDEANYCREVLETWWAHAKSGRKLEKSFWKLICSDVILRPLPQTDQTIRRTVARDELHFVAWSLWSSRSPFHERPEHIPDTQWSKLGRAYKSMLLLWPQPAVAVGRDHDQDHTVYLPRWQTRYDIVDWNGKPAMLDDQVITMRLLHLTDLYEAFKISDLVDDARLFRRDGPWKELYEAVTQKLCNELGLDELSKLYSTDDDILMIDRSIMAITVSRRLIVGEFQIGLGPADTKVGDELFFLEGGRTPFVLRRRVGTIDRLGRFEYEIIGDCYVQDLMDNGSGQYTKSLTDLWLV